MNTTDSALPREPSPRDHTHSLNQASSCAVGDQWMLISEASQSAREFLLSQRTNDDHWIGQLSTSALSTATAVSAMVQSRNNGCVSAEKHVLVDTAIEQGCQWLLSHQNSDGGWGDTDRSHSNIATTFLVIAAVRLARGEAADSSPEVRSAWNYVESKGKWDGLRKRYGKDKTFVVPILSNCALAGLVPWTEVSPLPFEAAWLPQKWYRLAKMPVVSYAIPALVAIGQARFHFAPTRIPGLRWLRRRAIEPTLRVLDRMQPESGGYLEATPLTSFVLMNLAAIGKGHLPVSQNCLRFILDSQLADGSWPIDTNLATWGTSLAWHALSRRTQLQLVTEQATVINATQSHSAEGQVTSSPSSTIAQASLPLEQISVAGLRWLLSCQHRKQHPFTGAIPGGWGWTDLSGAVPDADDTPAALLALSNMDWSGPTAKGFEKEVLDAVGLGLRWLVQLQNRDGGWPTFCRGWGQLPFDRSGTDLTAHALRAIHNWLPKLERIVEVCSQCPSKAELERATRRGLAYLIKTQQANGSWLPLWFGNQDRAEEDNPYYGTGKVLLAFGTLGLSRSQQVERAVEFLVKSKNPDGGWGGSWETGMNVAAARSSTIEESAVVLEGLLESGGQTIHESSIISGLSWLAEAIQRGGLEHASPIGFYFAKLWYYEKLYPALFGLSALATALRLRQVELSR